MNKKYANGFTLVELLMVILIVAILSAVAVPQYTKVVEKAKVTEARTALSAIRTAEGVFFSENDEYSDTLEDMVDSNVLDSDNFSYAITTTSDTYTVTATRSKGKYKDDEIYLKQDGTMTVKDSAGYSELLGVAVE